MTPSLSVIASRATAISNILGGDWQTALAMTDVVTKNFCFSICDCMPSAIGNRKSAISTVGGGAASQENGKATLRPSSSAVIFRWRKNALA